MSVLPRWKVALAHSLSSTYSLLSLSLVGFHLHLQLVHQILQPENILPVFLRLKQLANRKESELISPPCELAIPLGKQVQKFLLPGIRVCQPKEASCLTW